MGMFDTVVCRYPLPHHQDAEFQTKDLAAIALGERFVSGLLDEYEIAADGRLRRHVHEREWTSDPDAFLGGYMRSVKDWWEDVPDAHGDVVMYTSEDIPGQQGHRWVEFRVRFTNGRVQQVHETPAREESATQPADAGALRLHRPVRVPCHVMSCDVMVLYRLRRGSPKTIAGLRHGRR